VDEALLTEEWPIHGEVRLSGHDHRRLPSVDPGANEFGQLGLVPAQHPGDAVVAGQDFGDPSVQHLPHTGALGLPPFADGRRPRAGPRPFRPDAVDARA